MIDPLEKTIVCVATSVGKTHDFALFKSSRLTLLSPTVLLADTGYQGVDTVHPNSWTPFKKSKRQPLTPGIGFYDVEVSSFSICLIWRRLCW